MVCRLECRRCWWILYRSLLNTCAFASAGRSDCVSLLMEQGAHVSVQHKASGRTPVHVAAAKVWFFLSKCGPVFDRVQKMDRTELTYMVYKKSSRNLKVKFWKWSYLCHEVLHRKTWFNYQGKCKKKKNYSPKNYGSGWSYNLFKSTCLTRQFVLVFFLLFQLRR